MCEQSVDRFLAAVHQVQDPRWEPGLVRQLYDPGRREGDLLARLEDERVAGGDGIGPEPERHHRREVERRDTRKDTQRLADVLTVDPRSYVFQCLAHHQSGDAAGVLDVLDAPADRAAGFVECLAVLPGDRGSDVVELLLHQRLEPEQVARPDDRRHLSPRHERVLRRGDRLVHVLRVGERYTPERLGRRRVRDLQEVIGG